MTTKRVCGECERSILKRDQAVLIKVMSEVPNTSTRYKVVGEVFLHPTCYRRTGLAGRWKTLQAKREALK